MGGMPSKAGGSRVMGGEQDFPQVIILLGQY